MKKINKKMSMFEILQVKPDAAEILFDAGMHCVGCPMSQMESLEDGCRGHGFSDEEIEKLVDRLNE